MIYTKGVLFFLLFSFAFPQTQLGADIDGEAENDKSGERISMSSDGSRVAIGAIWNDGNGDWSGHVRIYENVSGNWTQVGLDIDGEAADDRGGAVSMNADGSRVAIGARSNDGNGTNSGHVRVYELNNSSWVQMGADIDGKEIREYFGTVVSMNADGSIVASGSYGANSGRGLVRIYEYSDGSWIQLGSDIVGDVENQYSGTTVSINADGSRVAIGAYGYGTGNGEFSGHVRIYEYSDGSWTQLGSDIDGEYAYDYFGATVSMNADGDKVAIGASGGDVASFGISGDNYGHVKIYEYSDGSWIQLGGNIDGEAAGDRSGYLSMSSDGSRVAIATSGKDDNGIDSGNVRIYEYSDGSWIKLGGNIDGEAAGDRSGYSLSMSSDGSRVAIGAPENDGNGSNSGHVRVYLTNPAQVTFQPQNLDELKTAVNLWTSDKTTALSTYGEINKWDISLITDMNCLFCNKYTFNDDISNWDMSNVTKTYAMFFRAKDFNQDISSWDVSNVTDMRGMFREAQDFNQDISGWDVSSATLTASLFRYATSFNQDISSWDVSNVTAMGVMFATATSFNQDISSWDVSSVTDMADMFLNADALSNQNKCSIHTKFSSNAKWSYDWSGSCLSSFKPQTTSELKTAVNLWVSDKTTALSTYGDINKWDVSLITDMFELFRGTNFNDDISSWDVSSVTNMKGVFQQASSFNQDISNWDVSNVTITQGLFNQASSFNQDISNWDVSSVTNMKRMFSNASSFNQDISKWDVSSATDMSYIFDYKNDLSDANKCAIHTKFSSNEKWSYDWFIFCPDFYKNKSPISLSQSPASIESADYTIDANGILNKSIDWSLPAVSDTGDIIEFIVSSDWHNKRPKDLQILYGKKVIATWAHPSKENGGCAKDLDDYLKNGLTISASDCNTSTPSFSTGFLSMKFDINESDSLKLRILSAWEEYGIIFNGAWMRAGIYATTKSSALYVSTSGSDLTGDGTLGNPFYTIQKGINHSKDADTVSVAAGVYTENIDFTGKNISIIGANRMTTIIDGDSSGTVVTIDSGEDSTAMLKGFTIRNGIASKGGGIAIRNGSNPLIKNVIVSDNRSHVDGGGIYVYNARASISNTIIKGNNSDGVAGGLYGGEGAKVTVSNSEITNNVAAVRGGAIHTRKETSFHLKHTLISHNSSYEGGGLSSWYGSFNVENVTAIGNTSTTNRGNAIFLRETAQMVLVNSIVMGNEYNVIYLEDPESSFSATYSMISKGWEGEGNIIADPLFCDLGKNQYSLWENSPCLGSGKDGANMGAFGMGCDVPKAFEWISSAIDTINITKSNLSEIYKLEWGKSNNQFGDVNYKVYASVGNTPYIEIYDTTATNLPIPYQDFYEGVFESFPIATAATVKFSVSAIEGKDTIKVTGNDRVVYMNRYEYLSTSNDQIPIDFALHENYPNPFNPTTTIRFDLPETSDANLVIYNMLGQKVRTFQMNNISAGTHTVKWNATNDLGEPVSAGVYLYQFRAKGFIKNQKMVLLK